MRRERVFVYSVLMILTSILLIGCIGGSEVTISFISSDENYPVRDAVIKLIKNDGNLAHVYEKTVSGNRVVFTKIPFGDYTLSATCYDFNSTEKCSLSITEKRHNQEIIFVREWVLGGAGPAGGIIFYDKGAYSNGWRYLEAAPASSEFNAPWGASRHDVSGTQTGIGTGKRNTEIIIANLVQLEETSRAARFCQSLNTNGYSDWFLPSKDELNLMYQNLHRQGLGRFGRGNNKDSFENWFYWSSSQSNSTDACSQYFANGFQAGSSKNFMGRVRAVRAF